MKISEMINDLRTFMQDYGDLHVVNEDDQDIHALFSPASDRGDEGDNEDVIVLA